MATTQDTQSGVDSRTFVDLILDSIIAGDLDTEDLERIAEACVTQRRLQARRDSLSLRYDDRVQVKARVSPKYLVGRTGTFKGRDGSRLLVLMDECFDRRVSGRQWRMSPGSIEKVEAES